MALFQTANLRLEQDAPDRATLWLDVSGRSVNVFNRQVLADLDSALDQLEKQPSLKVLTIRSAKVSGFIVGADVNEFAAVRTAADAVALSERGQRLFARLERLPLQTVAVIHGPCLGGGLELALACDYRVVIDQPKTELGLPESFLGLVPGWGGTQRLPRVIGLEPALKMILAARRLKAAEAVKWGLAVELISEADLADEERMRAYLDTVEMFGHKKQRTRLPLRTWRQRLVESNPLGRYLIFRGTERLLRQRVPDDMPAPWEALKAVRIGITQGMEAGLAYEREAIGRLALTPACHNLVNLFFQREKAKKLPAELRGDLVRPIKRIGVVGAGTMGAGIAQLAAVRDCEVVVQEVNELALAAGMKKIDDLFSKAVANRVLPQAEADEKRGRIRGTTSWAGFGDVDLAVEAVIEEVGLKRTVFQELERRTKPTTILATNTSSLLVERMQEGREHPERVGGLHFFNPVHKMPLVEVVRGPATDEATVATLTQWAIDLGKVPVVVKDSPGFLVNRILMPYLNEAVLLLRDGWQVDRIDRIMRRFGMPAGPLELLDQVGLDVTAHIADSMRGVVEERIPVSPVFAKMVSLGLLGQKCGYGFYCYTKGKKPNPGIHMALPDDTELDDLNLPPSELAIREACDRLVLSMVKEASMCLSEGIVASAEQLDGAMVFGTGWAPHRGGPLHYADSVGISEVVRILTELSTTHGPRFEPCAELRRRAANHEPFIEPVEALTQT